MAEHTPGPWAAGHLDDCGTCRIGVSSLASNDLIAEVCAADGFIPTGRGEANARLIAAAPDLLAALCEMVEAAEEEGRAYWPMVMAARAAIARVTGAAD